MSAKYPEPPDYDAIELEAWKKAHGEVPAEATELDEWLQKGYGLPSKATDRTSRLLKRISGFVWRFGYKESDVLAKIKQDTMFAAWFAKEPRRQGFHEAIAADWVKALPQVNDFKILPKFGKNAVRVSGDGNIESESGTKKLPGKSLDFKWKTGNLTFYAMHKYTKEGGGNQDSQFKEMDELMKRFYQCQDKKVVLVVIVDGEYYQDRDQARIKQLKNNERLIAPKSHVLTIGDLPLLLDDYV